jgi:hypothetical protein
VGELSGRGDADHPAVYSIGAVSLIASARATSMPVTTPGMAGFSTILRRGRVTEARHFAAVPLMLPRDPRGMREGVGELVFSAHAFQIACSS